MRLQFGFVLLLTWAGVAWATPAGLAQQQAQAKQEQAELRKQIKALQKNIQSQESARRDAANALQTSESAISDINAKLTDLASETKTVQRELDTLKKQTNQEQSQLIQRQEELADQLRAQYASGLSPWMALLSGDDPRTIGRDLAYLGYISAAQAQAVLQVRQGIEKLADLRKKTQAHEAGLVALSASSSQQKQALQEQQAERQLVLQRIETQLKEQRGQEGRLAQNDQRLGALITGLEATMAKLAEEARIAEQKRQAEAARKAEQARLAAIERQRALDEQREQARQAELTAKAAHERAQRERDTQEAEQARLQVEQARAQAKLLEQAHAAEQQQQRVDAEQAAVDRARQVKQEKALAASAEGLRKGRPSPVRGGDVLGRFGAQRPDGGVWRGVVLRSPEGTPVQAISGGKVAYSSWLSGFGNILIVDHGAGYLSVYAHNQSLLKQVGDTVTAGDTIATVGATGGQVEPGLYFEIRQNGVPVNPLLWLRP
ncbi:peptidoglycan DD-metalloendopeptidase family protein [Alcaligenaceae bacterium]|nr:peptidoglycan DD-metalloendopeptidase family protein [Alcaligenaceae bacterium]